MAISVKTRELYFPVLQSALNTTETAFTSITIPIPESSISFKSVVFELSANDVAGTASNYTRRQLSIQLDGSGFSVQNNTGTFFNSGENITMFHSYNFTSYFNTYWSGTSMTCDARTIITQGSLPEQRDLTLKVTLTYTYDTDSAIHAKTVWLPIGLTTSSLPTTKTFLGNLPPLDTYLPEDSKTYNQVTIVVEGNDYLSAITAVNSLSSSLFFEIDSSGSFSSLPRTGSLVSARYFRYTAQPNYMSGSGGVLNMWTGIGSIYRNQNVYLNVDYNFQPTSSRIFNSIILSNNVNSNMPGVAGVYYNFTSSFMISEPGDISFMTSSILYTSIPHTNGGVEDIRTIFRLNKSPQYTRTDNNSANFCGDRIMGNLITSASLSRGYNYIYNSMGNFTQVAGSFPCFVMCLNYISDGYTLGVHNHNKTIKHPIHIHGASGNSDFYSLDFTGSMFDTNYFLKSYIVQHKNSVFAGTARGNLFVTSGSTLITANLVSIGSSPTEAGFRSTYYDLTKWVSRYDNSTDISSSVNFKRFNITNAVVNYGATPEIMGIYTYDGIKYLVSGSIKGSSGGTVTIDLYDKATDSKVMTTSRTGNGSYSFNWYNNVDTVYTIARESDTLKGTSRVGYAGSGSYNIGLFNTSREYLF